MDPQHYDNFDLLVVKAESGFDIRVLKSPSGEDKAVRIASPLSKAEMDWLRKAQPIRDAGDRAAAREVRRIGGRVFEEVFGGEVGILFRRSLDAARREGKGLRLRLRLSEAGELSEFPWEYLYDQRREEFVALQRGVTVVRFLNFPEPVRPPAKPPIRMLVWACLPEDCSRLDADSEWRQLSTALKSFHREGTLQAQRLSGATLEELEEHLSGNQYHILHFIGHGHYDRDQHSGELLLVDAQGQSRPLSSEKLSVLLSGQQELRLAVLNCCEGARASLVNPFAGLAQSLLAKGVPAAVAMQFPVTDQGALDFARLFYGTLGGGLPVDAAAAQSRLGLCLGLRERPLQRGSGPSPSPLASRALSGGVVEWGAPVVYMRSDDGRLFDLPERRRQPAGSRVAGRPLQAGRQYAGGARKTAWLAGPLLLLLILFLAIWFEFPEVGLWSTLVEPTTNTAQLVARWGAGAQKVLIVCISQFTNAADLDRQLSGLADWRSGRVLVYRAFYKASSAYPLAVYEQGERKSYNFGALYSTEGTSIARVQIKSRTGCLCWDGEQKEAKGSGACSGHKGVRRWLHDLDAVVALLCGDDQLVSNTGEDACGASAIAWPIRNQDIIPVDLTRKAR